MNPIPFNAPLTLPITDPVMIVAIAGAIFQPMPLLMGIIIAGAVIGSNALNLLARGDPGSEHVRLAHPGSARRSGG